MDFYSLWFPSLGSNTHQFFILCVCVTKSVGWHYLKNCRYCSRYLVVTVTMGNNHIIFWILFFLYRCDFALGMHYQTVELSLQNLPTEIRTAGRRLPMSYVLPPNGTPHLKSFAASQELRRTPWATPRPRSYANLTSYTTPRELYGTPRELRHTSWATPRPVNYATPRELRHSNFATCACVRQRWRSDFNFIAKRSFKKTVSTVQIISQTWTDSVWCKSRFCSRKRVFRFNICLRNGQGYGHQSSYENKELHASELITLFVFALLIYWKHACIANLCLISYASCLSIFKKGISPTSSVL